MFREAWLMLCERPSTGPVLLASPPPYHDLEPTYVFLTYVLLYILRVAVLGTR